MNIYAFLSLLPIILLIGLPIVSCAVVLLIIIIKKQKDQKKNV